MKTKEEPSKSKKVGAAAREPEKVGKDALDPCDKAYNQETARLKDADEACDDGVR